MAGLIVAPAGRRELGEPGHGLDQTVGLDAGQAGEPGRVVRADDVSVPGSADETGGAEDIVQDAEN